MYTPAFATTLFALVAVAAAKSANPDPQYALMTVANEYTLGVIDDLITANQFTGVAKIFSPVKQQIEKELESGKADLMTITTEIGQFVISAEEASPGFTKKTLEVTLKNPVDFYTISDDAPEASWDFFYDAAGKAAVEAKNDKITAQLKTLKEEVDVIFASSTPDASAVSAKVKKFLESAKTISPEFDDLVYSKGDVEINKYRASVAALGGEESSSGGSDAGSASTVEEVSLPAGQSGSGEADGSSTSTSSVTTTTPIPSKSGASSLVLTGLVSVVAAAITAFAL